jgi:glutathione S-transferase
MDVLKALPERPVFRDYVSRLSERPAYKRSQERDMAMAMANPVLRQQFGGQG